MVNLRFNSASLAGTKRLVSSIYKIMNGGFRKGPCKSLIYTRNIVSNHYETSQTGANQHISQQSKIYAFEIHLFSFYNTKQTNVGVFSYKTRKEFNSAKFSAT